MPGDAKRAPVSGRVESGANILPLLSATCKDPSGFVPPVTAILASDPAAAERPGAVGESWRGGDLREDAAQFWAPWWRVLSGEHNWPPFARTSPSRRLLTAMIGG
jgi:hypothetical protein